MQPTIPMTINIPREVLAEMLAACTPIDRHRAMVERLGEACSKTTAAREIECSTQTITKMLEDGRLQAACEGTRVDVRSLADYIERRPQADREARFVKKYGSTLHV